MKFFLVLVVILIGIWLWRSGRQVKPPAKGDSGTPAHEPQDMVRCDLCAVHFPKADSVAGKHGVYCSAEHRQRAEH